MRLANNFFIHRLPYKRSLIEIHIAFATYRRSTITLVEVDQGKIVDHFPIRGHVAIGALHGSFGALCRLFGPYF